MDKPLAIDLYCGLGGWTDGLLAEGYDVLGFDIERHQYGDAKYPAQLVLQDVLTLHGSQFKDAALIVASPPCQNYSYLAMPWSRSTNPNNSLKAKALRKKWETEGPDNRLFDACFRIQREACEAAGRFIPLVVENVRGAQPWVGPTMWNFGSFYLWGNLPGLMPSSMRRKVPGSGSAVRGDKKGLAAVGFNVLACRQLKEGQKNDTGGSWFAINGSNQVQPRNDPRYNRQMLDGVKGFTPQGQPLGKNELGRKHGSKSAGRKAASAQIAQIPLPLSRHIARCYYPC